jgi:hypothetical protein
MKRNKKTKPVRSAHKKLFDSDAYTDILDAALTSAEDTLKALLPMLKPPEISQAFATHIHTHLSTELSKIAAHGHRNDDPEAVPQAKPDVLAALKQAASVLDLWLNGPGDADGKETDAALMVANAAILAADAGHRNDDPEDIPPTNQDWDTWRVEVGRYVVSSDDVLIADCYADSAMDFGLPEPSEYRVNARLITKSPQMATFVNLVARMKTEGEFANNAPPSEDWIRTLNDLIVEARKIAKL